MRKKLSVITEPNRTTPTGIVELVVDGEHFRKLVLDGICTAKISLDIATADFKAMLVPTGDGSRNAKSIVARIYFTSERFHIVSLKIFSADHNPKLELFYLSRK